MTMESRRAILFGIPQYSNDSGLDPLKVASFDVAAMKAILESSGYEVLAYDGSNPLDLSRNMMCSKLEKACQKADEGETLVFFFSGHGLHYAGQDYLIPIDGSLSNLNKLKDTLVPVDLQDAIDKSSARTVLFFIDACREGIELELKGSQIGTIGGSNKGKPHPGSSANFITIFSCSAGEFSRYDPKKPEALSYFTRALCEALSPETPPTTIREVIDYAQERLDNITKTAGKGRQQINYRLEIQAGSDDPLEALICEGPKARVMRAVDDSPWCKAVRETQLFWRAASEETAGAPLSLRRKLKDFVLQAVGRCWIEWQTARNALPENPWLDEEFPLRVLRRCERLVLKKSASFIFLTETEIALLVLAPFVREAVLASSQSKAAREGNPLSLVNTDTTEGIRGSLERLYEGMPQWVRKAERLRELGKVDDYNTVASWLLTRLLMQEPEVWLCEKEGGWLSEALVRDITDLPDGSSELMQEALAADRIFELARCVAASTDWIEQRYRHKGIRDSVAVGSDLDQQTIEERRLAYLHLLAGHMALDIRRMSSVLADHIGLSDPVDLKQVMKHLRRAKWVDEGDNCLTLELKDCDHPALDFVLVRHIESMDMILHHLAPETGGVGAKLTTLAHLPKHFTATGITIREIDGKQVFHRPHLSFELDRDQILQLLMGEQLYGDPTLAIRELYQNALDACRYRQARETYLHRKNGVPDSENNEHLFIRFEQSIDAQGCAYIECRDNGIGMGKGELEGCFTHAGRRFADTPEFLEEKARWKKYGVEFYPNSQFGIGVLSYFMLADELEVETCRLSPDDLPGELLRTTISGSGSLFRTTSQGQGRESGTRVRLYLNRLYYKRRYREDKKISVLKTLRNILLVAEFPTTVVEGGEKEYWEPWMIKRNDVYPTGHRDIWWAPLNLSRISVADETGQLLADGLTVRGVVDRFLVNSGDKHPFLVINLRAERRPRLAVNRNQILSWEKDWPKQALSEVNHLEPKMPLWHSVLNIPNLSFTFLACIVNNSSLKFSELIIHELMNRKAVVQTGWEELESHLHSRQRSREIMGDKTKKVVLIPIAELGVISQDYETIQLSIESFDGDWRVDGEWSCDFEFLHQYRLSILERYGLPVHPELKSCIQLKELPNIPLLPSDSLLLDFIEIDRFNRRENYPGHPSLPQLVEYSYCLNRPLGAIYSRLKQLEPLGFKVPILPEGMFDYQISDFEATILTRNCDRKSWIFDSVPFSQILLAAKSLGCQVSKVADSLRNLAPLGIDFPDIPDNVLDQVADKIMQQVWWRRLAELIDRFYIIDWKYTDADLHPALFARVSANAEIPLFMVVKKAAEILLALEPYGYKTLDVCTEISPTFISTKHDLVALSKDLDTREPWVTLSTHRIKYASG